MKNENNNGSNGGLTFLGLLQVAFIVLKLLKVINWSWLWVLGPTWIPLVIYIVFLVVIIFILK